MAGVKKIKVDNSDDPAVASTPKMTRVAADKSKKKIKVDNSDDPAVASTPKMARVAADKSKKKDSDSDSRLIKRIEVRPDSAMASKTPKRTRLDPNVLGPSKAANHYYTRRTTRALELSSGSPSPCRSTVPTVPEKKMFRDGIQISQEPDIARCITVESELVSESVKFRWKIGNFSADKLPKDGSPMKSPTFRTFNSTLHLELSRKTLHSDWIYLYLVRSSSDEPPWISDCTIGFAAPDKDDLLHLKKFSAPTRYVDISCHFVTSTMTKQCVSDNVLNVHCYFTATKLMRISDDECRSKMNEEKGN